MGVQQERCHADHAVHRRADLVAHGGEELGLEPGRLERALARSDEGVLRKLAIADVARDHGGVGQAAGGPARAGHLDRHHLAVRPAGAQLQGTGAIRSGAGPRDVRQRGDERVPGDRLDELGEGAAEGVRLRKPEDALGRGVPRAYGPVGADGDDGVGGRPRHRPELLLAPRERAQRQQAEGHEHEQGDRRARRRDERRASEQRQQRPHDLDRAGRHARVEQPRHRDHDGPTRPRPEPEQELAAGIEDAVLVVLSLPRGPLQDLLEAVDLELPRVRLSPEERGSQAGGGLGPGLCCAGRVLMRQREVADRRDHGEQRGHDRGQRRREARDERAGSLHRGLRTAANNPGETCRPKPVSSSRPAGEARKPRYCCTATAEGARVTR